MSDQYHLGELAVARNPAHPGHILPPTLPDNSRVLDVGCGAGQTLLAAYPRQITFGIDVDLSALRLGGTLTKNVRFVNAKAESLPFSSGEFDVVIARVSLAYTDLHRSFCEIHRVLKPNGLLWMTLHPLSIPWQQVKSSNWKGKIFFVYVVLNGLLFHFGQRQIPFLGKQESFQTKTGTKRALQSCGFQQVIIEQDQHFLVTARAGSTA